VCARSPELDREPRQPIRVALKQRSVLGVVSLAADADPVVVDVARREIAQQAVQPPLG